MNTLYAPLINASVEVELDVTMAHLLVEEILNGDHFEEAQVWENYARAEWYVKAILHGGERAEEIILPLQDKELRLIVEDLNRRLAEFKNISKERLLKREVSGSGTKIDKRYNRIFAVFLKEAKDVKRKLQHIMASDLVRFRYTHFALVATGLFMGLVVITTLYRQEKLRANDFFKLQEANNDLENEIEERLKAEKELKDSREHLRKLSNQLQSIREDEKTRIAREVHDELGQMLTGLKMELSCLENDLKQNPDCLSEKVESMEGLIDTTINSVRRIATELRPQILDVCGLPEAMEWQARDFQTRTGITCEIDIPDSDVKLDKKLSTSLFRVFQETLTNVARHAEANKVEVSLEVKSDGLMMTIQDNGIGIDPREYKISKSLGLLGIQERINFWNGKVVIRSQPNQGTTIEVSIPLKSYEPILQESY